MTKYFWQTEAYDVSRTGVHLKHNILLRIMRRSSSSSRYGLTSDEVDQINQSRKQIAEGKSKRFENVDKYLESL